MVGWRHACVIGLVLTACYEPGAEDCSYRCGPDGECPSNLECDGFMCRTPGAMGMCTGALQILPGTVSMAIERSLQFTATLDVTWQVEEAQGGTIDESGVYTAPSTLGTYHVI